MNRIDAFPLTRTHRRLGLLLMAGGLLVLAGCSTVKLWPFGSDEVKPLIPPNATRYQCDAGKSFYLRTLAGDSMWVILPDREFRLDRQGDAGARRFGNGAAVLNMAGDAVELADAPTVNYSGCKPAEAK